MFPYRVKYNESEYDIQNNDILYKIDQQYQNTFELCFLLEKFREKLKRIKLLFCYMYNLYNSIFVFFVNIVFCFLYYYIYIYITRVGILPWRDVGIKIANRPPSCPAAAAGAK